MSEETWFFVMEQKPSKRRKKIREHEKRGKPERERENKAHLVSHEEEGRGK